MDDDLSNDRADKGCAEDATDQLYHEDSDDSHMELNHPPVKSAHESFRVEPRQIQPEEQHGSYHNTQPSAFMPPSQLPENMQGQVPLQYQGTDLMHRIPLYPQLKTDLVNFTLPEEIPSPQAAVGRVVPPAVAQPKYQQLSRQQQLRLNPISLCFPNPLRYSSLPMYFPISPITTPRQPSSQMTLGHLPAERNPEEIKKLEDKLRSIHITKKPRPELGSKLDDVRQNTRLDSSAGENKDDKTSYDECYDSDEKIDVVEEDNAPTFNSALSSQFMTESNQQTLPPRLSSNDPSHDAPCCSYTVTDVTDLQLPNQSPLRLPLTQDEQVEVMRVLAGKIKNRRNELLRSQKRVAYELNLLCRTSNISENFSQQSISYLETEDTPSLKIMYKYKKVLELWLKCSYIKNPNSLVNKLVHTFQRCRDTSRTPKNSLEALERSLQRNVNKPINTTINCFEPDSSAISPVTRPDSMLATSSLNTPDTIFRARGTKAPITAMGIRDLGKAVQQNLKPYIKHTGKLPKPIPMNKKVMMSRSKRHHQIETAINVRTASSMPSPRPVPTEVTSSMVHVVPRSVATDPGNSNNLNRTPTFTDYDEEYTFQSS